MDRYDRDDEMLTREDIGYGPAQPYEYDVGMPRPRERRGGRRARPAAEAAPPGEGPYFRRLRRRRRPDPWIQADVEESLFLDTWIDADRITVDVDRGRVTLTGMLPDRSEIRRALEDARSVPGVVDVRSRLEVEA